MISRTPLLISALTATSIGLLTASSSAQSSVRPPSVPLIAHDPYFSVWSNSDTLTGSQTRHWTGAEQPLISMIRVDGKTYRLMGAEPATVDAMTQTGFQLLPTRTIYTFAGAGIEAKLTFLSPLLPDDIDLLSRPASYLTWEVKATDGRTHEASVFFCADSRLAVNTPNQRVVTSMDRAGTLSVLKIGSEEQPVLQKKGDNLRIDWGHLLLTAPGLNDGPGRQYVGSGMQAANTFMSSGMLPMGTFDAQARPASDGIVAAVALPLGKVGAKTASTHAVLAYDDEYSIQFMGHNLRPYWRRKGASSADLVRMAESDYARVSAAAAKFDTKLMADMTKAGGAAYAQIGTIAYRQSLAAQKVVADAKGQPLMFSKENFSNGCIATVDILYPEAPLLLLTSPVLMKATLVPVLEYSGSSRWKFPFAPHDLGTYPKANGQVYGGGERTEENQMPVEETGNMLIILAALAKIEENAKFSERYWGQLEKWAAYLADKGFDPESQLSTDDFAGHLAHNINLSAKAIEALGAYAYLADSLGKRAEATKYRTLAKSFAARWVKEAADGDHYRLAFDKAGTWSQKYNLVWDRMLGFNLFPASVMEKEIAYYKTKMNPFGLPLDNRADYTKLDWEIWTATMTRSKADFEFFAKPIARFLDETPDRVPMTDWYFTSQPKQRGFQARSVVGGVFIKMLADSAMWKRYATIDRTPASAWAPLPTPPEVTEVIPTASKATTHWAYTFSQPAEGWNTLGFNDSAWKHGPGGFGSGSDRGDAIVRTEWTSDDIWVRREFDVKAEDIDALQLIIQHDDDAEVYINGTLVMRLPGANRYETFELSKAAKEAMKPGKNVLAIHCKDTGGDQYIDAGFVTVKMAR